MSIGGQNQDPSCCYILILCCLLFSLWALYIQDDVLLFEKKMWMTSNITSEQFTTFKLKSVYRAKFFLWTMWCTHTKRNPSLINLIGDNILQSLECQDTIYIKIDSLTCYVRCRNSTRNQSFHDHCEKHKKIESLTHHCITYTCIPTQLWLSFIQASSHEMKMYWTSFTTSYIFSMII
jgi:hypothetical protein